MALTTKRISFIRTKTFKFTLDIPQAGSAGNNMSDASALADARSAYGPLYISNDIGELLAGSAAMNGAVTVTSDWAVSGAGTSIEPYSVWAPNTAYAGGLRVIPTANSDKLYTVALKTGDTGTPTTGATEPVWPATIGGTVDNGTVTFTCIAKF